MPYLGVRPADITSATEAEIAGDLTVDTNTLHVDSANNRVGVGTVNPGVGLEVTDSICVGRQSAATQTKFVGIGGSGGTFSNGVTGGAYIEYEVEADQDTLIHFVTNDQGNSHARRMTIAKDGGVSIADGNLTLASGHGINFGATGSGDDSTGQTNQSELLTDYEHGLWTPTVNGDSTYHFQYGMYHKIGRKVTAWFRIRINAKNTPQVDFFLDGLPYNNDHNGNIPGSGSVHFFSSIGASNVSLTARVDGGGSTINFSGNSSSGTTTSSVNTGWVADGAEIQGFVMYMTDYA